MFILHVTIMRLTVLLVLWGVHPYEIGQASLILDDSTIEVLGMFMN